MTRIFPAFRTRSLLGAAMLSVALMTSCQQQEWSPEMGLPQPSDNKLVLENGQVRLELNADKGARIVSFTLKGEELLAQPNAVRDNYGGTFWPAPQQTWHWPPPSALFIDPYSVTTNENGFILSSQPDQETGLQFTKKISKGQAKNCFKVEYTMTNKGNSPATFAPWEVIAVDAGGLIFFPHEKPEYMQKSTLRLQMVDGYSWYRTTLGSATQKSVKAYQDGAGTNPWVAYALPNKNMLFLLSFTPMPAGKNAPKHGEVEIFHNPTADYIELENQGGYQEIAPGKSVEHTVIWRMVSLPDSIPVHIGSKALLALAQSALKLK